MSKKTFEMTFSHKFIECGGEGAPYLIFIEQLKQWQKINDNRDYYVKRFEGKEDDRGLKIIAHLVIKKPWVK